MTLLNTRRVYLAASTLSLLLIPLVAMQFTEDVNWSGGDFLIMGILLLSVLCIIEPVRYYITSGRQRTILYLIVLIGFVLLWAEMAVGIFGSAIAGS